MKIVAIDFDGTMCVHKFPYIGRENPGAILTCKYLQENGIKLVLWTMRSGQALEEADDWCKERGLTFDKLNQNIGWGTESPKVYAQMYIDDAALGCPLRYAFNPAERPMVDWERVAYYLQLSGYINSEQLTNIRNEIERTRN